jgi:hypothetical protein
MMVLSQSSTQVLTCLIPEHLEWRKKSLTAVIRAENGTRISTVSNITSNTLRLVTQNLALVVFQLAKMQQLQVNLVACHNVSSHQTFPTHIHPLPLLSRCSKTTLLSKTSHKLRYFSLVIHKVPKVGGNCFCLLYPLLMKLIF